MSLGGGFSWLFILTRKQGKKLRACLRMSGARDVRLRFLKIVFLTGADAAIAGAGSERASIPNLIGARSHLECGSFPS